MGVGVGGGECSGRGAGVTNEGGKEYKDGRRSGR